MAVTISRRWIVIGGAILVVIGLLGAAVWWWMTQQKPAAPADSTTSMEARRAIEKRADDADKRAFEGDVSGGVKYLDEAINSAGTSYEKYVFYSRKATLLFNNKDLDGALVAAKAAYDARPTSDSAAFVGQIYLAKADTGNALEFYKKARDLVDPATNPIAKQDKQYYSEVIAQLEAGSR